MACGRIKPHPKGLKFARRDSVWSRVHVEARSQNADGSQAADVNRAAETGLRLYPLQWHVAYAGHKAELQNCLKRWCTHCATSIPSQSESAVVERWDATRGSVLPLFSFHPASVPSLPTSLTNESNPVVRNILLCIHASQHAH